MRTAIFMGLFLVAYAINPEVLPSNVFSGLICGLFTLCLIAADIVEFGQK